MRRLLQKLRIGARIVAFVLVTIACWTGMELAFATRGKRTKLSVVNCWVPRWAGSLLRVFGVKTAVRGLEAFPRGLYPGAAADGVGRIFVFNHRSALDIAVAMTTTEAHVISRHDVANWPLIGPGARRIGTLFVNRAERKSGAEVLKEVDASLARGEGVAMFPEGTAFAGDDVRPFRPGAFKAAQRAGAEIVPIGIAYDHPDACYVDESFMGHLKRVAGMKHILAAVEVGEPVQARDRDPNEVKDEVHAAVTRLVGRARSRLGQTAQTESQVFRATYN